MNKEKITKQQAKEIAEKMLAEYLTADYGYRLVSDNEDPLKAYLQTYNSYSMAGEVFNVKCPGIGNLDMSIYREGWDCENLDDTEVIIDCCENGDMTEDIEELAQAIYNSANKE